MTDATHKLFSKALALPRVERATLIEELLASFDGGPRASVDAVWAAESEERLDAYDRGELKAHTLEEAASIGEHAMRVRTACGRRPGKA